MSREPHAGVIVGEPSSPPRTGMIAWSLLAIVGYVALLDAAVETFVSGSPLRWWVGGPLVAFVALNVWLWRPGGALLRRFGPGAAAATAIGGVLLLLAATAWLPGGQTDGVRMLGQPTSTVLVATLAAILILATYVIVRGVGFLSPTPRLATRGVFILLAIYALVGLGVAVRDHATFASLFQGGAVWQRLPRWLQGTFIGGLVLLPLAILAQLLRITEHLRRKAPVRVLIHQTTALVMALVMATSGLVVPGMGATTTGMATMTGAAGGPPPTIGPITAAEFEQSDKELFGQKDPVSVGEDFVRAAEQELTRPGADPSDVAARATALGRDAQQIFEFLRDQVALEPYTGVLRGARGALAAGAGNALDRALLAQALLGASGVESRLMAGKLSATQADTLLGRFLATEPAGSILGGREGTPSGAALDAAARDVATKAGLAPDAVAAVLRRAAQRSDAFWWKADEQRAANLDFLAGQLNKGGVKAPADGQAVLMMLRDRLKEHYWVQVKDPRGAWVDFDPSFPDARPGAAFASDPVMLPKIPADRFHRFEVQLVYRIQSGGKPKSEVLIKREVASADALFEPLELRIQPGKAIADTKALRTMDARQRADMLRTIKQFQVLLRAGARVAGGRGFDFEGHTFDAKTGNPMGAAAGLMGGLLGFGAEPEPVEFLDLQIVLRLSGPGRKPMTQTRTIVRAADTKSPTFLPPIGEWQMLVQPQWISPDLAGFQVLSYLTGLTKGLTAALKAKKGLEGVTAPPPISQQLLQLALLRQHATAGILSGQPGLRALVDMPMLTIAGHRISALRPDEGRIVAERTIDIVENAIRFVTKDPESQAPFGAALGQGVADCTLEQRLLEDAFPELAASAGSTVFERARLEGREAVLTRAQDAGALRAAGLAETDVEWIGANESAQARVLVAKAAEGPAAWWSVRPDGTAVLRVSGGQGQAEVEHGTDVNLVALKVLAALVCGVEVVDAAHQKPSEMGGFTIAWCIAATGGSGALLLMQAHLASWILLALEGAVFLASQVHETYGEN